MFRTVCRWEASARDSSGQCALGAPRRKGDETSRSEKEGLNSPRHFILESEIRRDEGIQVERAGYERESKHSFEQGESEGSRAL